MGWELLPLVKMAAPMSKTRRMFTSRNACFWMALKEKITQKSACVEFRTPVTCYHNVTFSTNVLMTRNPDTRQFLRSTHKKAKDKGLTNLVVQHSRMYSNDSSPSLKGAVIYVQNPMSWMKTKWILFNLHRKYDSTFSIEEFLVGAKQALCVVTDLLSRKKFEDLQGLVHHEVLAWLEQKMDDMTTEEREAINLQDENIALLKARGMDLVENKEEVKLYIDTLCFGLRRDSNTGNGIPFLVDLGFRFCRDYSSSPPGDWYIGGVTHVRVQRLISK